MVPFAETEHLYIRGAEERDLPKLTELFDDPRTQRAGPALVVPGGAAIARLVLALGSGGAGGLRLVGILEAKQPRGDGQNDDDRWVGFVCLGIPPGEEVQRDAGFGIALMARWWGLGLGTEATRWIVGYGFEQLALHRISLEVLADNPRAVELYKYIGFVEEVTFRKMNWQDSKWGSILEMGILRDEWPPSRSDQHADFAEPSVNCNIIGAEAHANLWATC